MSATAKKLKPEEITVRCSSTDSGLRCAGHWAPTDAPYNPESDDSREGDAGHEVMAQHVMGVDPDIEAIARKHSVDPDELRRMYARGKKAWEEVKQWFPNPSAEHRLEGLLPGGARKITLRGTADLVQLVGQVAVLDWKFGWAPTVHPKQLKSYSYLAMENAEDFPDDGHVIGIEAWLRVGELRVHRFSRKELFEHEYAIVQQIERIGTQYGPSDDACKYCPH